MRRSPFWSEPFTCRWAIAAQSRDPRKWHTFQAPRYAVNEEAASELPILRLFREWCNRTAMQVTRVSKLSCRVLSLSPEITQSEWT